MENNIMNENETFKMTYSAEQQDEIQAIRRKYMIPEEEDKMEQIRALDAKTTTKATMTAITVGVFGTLLMGLGMSLFMSDFGAFLGTLAMPVGIVIGLMGIALGAFAYPLYLHTLKKEREKVAPEILRLTDELMK